MWSLRRSKCFSFVWIFRNSLMWLVSHTMLPCVPSNSMLTRRTSFWTGQFRWSPPRCSETSSPTAEFARRQLDEPDFKYGSMRMDFGDWHGFRVVFLDYWSRV